MLACHQCGCTHNYWMGHCGNCKQYSWGVQYIPSIIITQGDKPDMRYCCFWANVYYHYFIAGKSWLGKVGNSLWPMHYLAKYSTRLSTKFHCIIQENQRGPLRLVNFIMTEYDINWYRLIATDMFTLDNLISKRCTEFHQKISYKVFRPMTETSTQVWIQLNKYRWVT